LRSESVNNQEDSTVSGKGTLRHTSEAWIWKVWSISYSSPSLHRLVSWAGTRLSGLLPKKLGAWTNYRSRPTPAKRTLHELAKSAGVAND